jgi:hypothetical protein
MTFCCPASVMYSDHATSSYNKLNFVQHFQFWKKQLWDAFLIQTSDCFSRSIRFSNIDITLYHLIFVTNSKSLLVESFMILIFLLCYMILRSVTGFCVTGQQCVSVSQVSSAFLCHMSAVRFCVTGQQCVAVSQVSSALLCHMSAARFCVTCQQRVSVSHVSRAFLCHMSAGRFCVTCQQRVSVSHVSSAFLCQMSAARFCVTCQQRVSLSHVSSAFLYHMSAVRFLSKNSWIAEVMSTCRWAIRRHLISFSVRRSVGWLVGWLVGWSVGWLFGRLVDWLFD